MLTSAGFRGDAARCRELGIRAYLTKPIKRADLLQAIKIVLGAKTVGGENAAIVTIHSMRENRGRLRILLAEDNAVNQTLAVRLLEKRGHEVIVAGNGEAALEALGKQDFDLILMDVQMPQMNGLQATAAIRLEELTSGKHIPIIAMTAHAMAGDKERCLEAGMDAYISKPIRVNDLFSASRKFYWRLQELRSQLHRQGSDSCTTRIRRPLAWWKNQRAQPGLPPALRRASSRSVRPCLSAAISWRLASILSLLFVDVLAGVLLVHGFLRVGIILNLGFLRFALEDVEFFFGARDFVALIFEAVAPGGFGLGVFIGGGCGGSGAGVVVAAAVGRLRTRVR